MANNFTERESEIMAKTWLCVKEVPKIDYNDLANMCGFANPRSASNAWINIRKKLDAMADGIPKSTAEAGGKASPKKRGKDGQADGNDDSPTKKPRGKGAAKKKVIKKQDDDDVKVKNESGDGSEEDESSMI